jgi:hypothetical protein
MDLTRVAAPVGRVTHMGDVFRHTAPEFAAFVLIETR